MNGSEVPLVRAIRGPITLITVGVLFALNNFTHYSFNQTWPVLLIVFGLLSLLSRGAGVPRAARSGAPGFPHSRSGEPYGFPPPPPPDTGSSSYRQSSYTGTATPPPPSGPAKGGFGSSAPPRAGDSGQTPPSGDSV
ncbi:conserved hypothetical protein [Candidatus Sulfopaludibacter sp. SbA4]|nr:conserved hypothetical protein [Candidatus Sulfopaludibacter sp. SbA4]